MARRTYPYNPNYAVPPGYVLEDHLEAKGLTPAEFAERHALTTGLVEDLLTGAAPIDATLASILEQDFDLTADLWLKMEATYRRRREQIEAAKRADGFAPWAKSFPMREMVKRGIVEKPHSDGDGVLKLLAFFGVPSVEEWQCRHDAAQVAYRHSPTFASNEFNLAAWLRLGEIESEWQECAQYDAAKFRAALKHIRSLTRQPTGRALEEAILLCNQSGVALALIEPLPKVALSGVARWLRDDCPLIQLSARHKTNDHLWYSLFHEAAHILLHSKEQVFIDTMSDEIAGIDAEADRWASDFLIPRSDWGDFADAGYFGEWAVRRFAHEQGIAPAIVVGRLQHEHRIPWSRLNHLKAKMRWQEAA